MEDEFGKATSYATPVIARLVRATHFLKLGRPHKAGDDAEGNDQNAQ